VPAEFGVNLVEKIRGNASTNAATLACCCRLRGVLSYDLTGSYAIPFGAAPLAVLASWGLFALGSSRRHA